MSWLREKAALRRSTVPQLERQRLPPRLGGDEADDADAFIYSCDNNPPPGFYRPLAVGSIAAFFLYFPILPVAVVAVILIGIALPGDPPSDCARRGWPPAEPRLIPFRRRS